MMGALPSGRFLVCDMGIVTSPGLPTRRQVTCSER